MSKQVFEGFFQTWTKQKPFSLIRKEERMFAPTSDLLTGIQNCFPAQLFPWDDYFPRMAETDFLSGNKNRVAVKSFFIREAPSHGSFAFLGGITEALRTISALRFDNPHFQKGLKNMGYCHGFQKYLAKEQFLRIELWGGTEGQMFFPHEPIVTVIGTLPHIRLVEGVLTEALNFSSLSLTKWSRLVQAVYPGQVLEFGRRRAQNHQKATLYAMLAGCFATSNSEMSRFFNFKVIGTMGHEWVQGFGDVRRAFETWIQHQPSRPIALVDTKQCLAHDFPIWLDVVYANKDQVLGANPTVWGWRNDSGDLEKLTLEQIRMLYKHPLAEDSWFRDCFRVVLTNELDEHRATSIRQQIRDDARKFGLDPEEVLRRIIWAAGTKPAVCADQPALGGVMKLGSVENHACIKLAFDAHGAPGLKTSIPGHNSSALIFDSHGEPVCILIYPHHAYVIRNGKLQRTDLLGHPLLEITAHHPDNPGRVMNLHDYTARDQQLQLFDSFSEPRQKSCYQPTIHVIPEHIRRVWSSLPSTMRRLDQPEVMPVMLTSDLYSLRRKMIEQGALRSDFLKDGDR